MIDLTPLDVRNKRGDFKRLMRGYDPQEVDIFLELVAERLEGLVRENLQLKERAQTLQQQVTSQLGREQAVQDALVTAQELRADIKAQSQREAEHVLKEAETESRRLIAEAEAQVRGKLRGVERQIEGAQDSLVELERRRKRFLKDFRGLLEREFDIVEVEEGRTPREERVIDLDIGSRAGSRPPHSASPGGHEMAAMPTPPPLPPTATAEGRESAASPHGSGEALTVDAESASGSRSGAAAADRDEDNDADPSTRNHGAPAHTNAFGGDASLPTELETPLFTSRARSPAYPDEDEPAPYDELAASMEAEAVAQARSQVVEVTGDDIDAMPEVPRLEELLAEAGAELIEAQQEQISQAPPDAEEIAPPRVTKKRDHGLLVYPDNDDAGR